MWEELIPYFKVSLIMFNIYILARMFSREVVRLDLDKPIEIKTKGFYRWMVIDNKRV